MRDGEDWREDQNRRDDKAVREVQAMIAHLEGFGIDVNLACDPDDVEGGKAECRRYLGGSPEWVVRVSGDLVVSDRLRMLEWAWKALTPTNDTSWSGPVVEDEHGERFRGCYYSTDTFGMR